MTDPTDAQVGEGIGSEGETTAPTPKAPPALDFDEWLRFGVHHGYCTEQFCSTHGDMPMDPSEEAAWEGGYDPCCHVVRLGQQKDWKIDG